MKLFLVNAFDNEYRVAAYTAKEAEEIVNKKLLEESEEHDENITSEEILEDFMINYEEEELPSISAYEYMKCLRKPEILTCSEW
ncbi:hypothetical protein ACR79K_27155 [Sphingobacterium siyangense]|uniref:hypothetical protein n=1 Tax=Sphingobacterium siyangense TaxID=459529 RepID=UPI003DA34627